MNTKVNILLVDDQPAKLLSYETILQDLGENLIKAGSAREALECLLKEDIAVVLVDVCMPELDGYELASMIREHPRCRRTSVIFVSAVFLNDPDRLRGYQAGAVDYIPVPVVPEILRAKVSVFADLYRKTRELETFTRELEQRVCERTAALAATTEKLRESDRRKDDFLAILSHELRNPLAPIRNSLFVLTSCPPESEQSSRARAVIERQVNHLVRLVDDLLDVTRISRGKVDVERAPIDLEQLVRGVADDYRAVLAVKGVELRLQVTGKALRIVGDVTRLSQVFGNLLQNAAKFTPRGGHVSLELGSSKTHAEIWVRDTGVGIAPELVEHLFDPFVQGVQPLDRSAGGLGLGLALVKGLVELHGGDVQLANGSGSKGASFLIRLPLSDDARTFAPALAPSNGAPPKRVLIIEDNMDAAQSLAEALQMCGLHVDIANDAESGITRAQASPPDAVICDVGLPRMSGYEVASTLREEASLSETLLVALSGYARPEDKKKAVAAGFHHHLAKPPSIHELVELVREGTPKEPSPGQ